MHCAVFLAACVSLSLPAVATRPSALAAGDENPRAANDESNPARPADKQLQKNSKKAVDALLEEFAGAEFFWQQGDIARELIALGDPAIIPRVAEHLDTPDRRKKCNAAMVLAALGDKRGLPIIIGELQDTKPRPTERRRSDNKPDPDGQIKDDRYYAALLLGQLKMKEAVPALIEASSDPTINARAAISLGEIGDKSAIPALHKMAVDFPNERLWAGYGLAALGEQEGFDLVSDTAVLDERWTERRHAVEALGQFGDGRVVPALKKALKDQERKIRIGAARALGQIGDDAALRALDEAAGEKPADEAAAADDEGAAADMAREHEYLHRFSFEQQAIAKFKASRLRHNTGPLAAGKLAEWTARQGLPPVQVVIAITPMLFDTRDDDLAPLAGLADITHVGLNGSKITDRGLALLSGLSKLQVLYIGDTQITDRGVAQIKGLTELRELWLRGTGVTDAGLANLEKLSRLESLLLGRTTIGDAGIAHLKNLQSLRGLGLEKTRVTDVGLAHLKGLKKLKYLDLYDTHVTDAGVAALQKALPELKINRAAPPIRH
jgi:HEAT repeat protein